MGHQIDQRIGLFYWLPITHVFDAVLFEQRHGRLENDSQGLKFARMAGIGAQLYSSCAGFCASVCYQHLHWLQRQQ